jgi:8-oxo-dGTP pyrophosphatase MutT (NUDIX family)
VWNEKEELLLVRNWGGKRQWSLPGGGVKRKERPLEAAKRELYEEVGLNVPLQKFDYVSTFFYQYEAPIFVVTVAKDDLPIKPHNPREITDQRWFPSKELPSDLSPLVSIALKYLSKND